MNNFKLYATIAVAVGVISLVLSLLFKISSLKDNIIELEKLKNKQEIAYFALKSSYSALEIACKKQSDELMKLSNEYKKKEELIKKYQTLPDSGKYNDTVLEILGKPNVIVPDDKKCQYLIDKINRIGKLNYKEL